MKEKTVQINATYGIRNDVDTERLATGDLDGGVNIDIDVSGKPARRLGTTKRISASPSSLWAADGDNVGYFVDGSNLNIFQPPSTVRTLRSDLTPGRRMAFGRLGETGPIYYTNGDVAGRVVQGVDKPWGIAVPATPGAIVTWGDLKAGRYGYTLNYRRRDGTQSGAPVMQVVQVADNEGVELVGIPASSDPDVVAVRIYFTGRNGTKPFYVGEVPNGTSTFSYTFEQAGTIPCDKILKGPPPPGHFLFDFYGRMIVVQGSYGFYSDAYAPEIFDLRKGFISFADEPTVIAPVTTGIFVATRQETFFYRGTNPAEFTVASIAPYGAPKGDVRIIDGAMVTKDGLQGQVAAWMSDRGLVVGDDNGVLTNLTQKRYVAPQAARSALTFKQRGGLKQLISVLFS